jgi:hypothetical protein
MKPLKLILMLGLIAANIPMFGIERNPHSSIMMQNAHANDDVDFANVQWTPERIEHEIRKTFPEAPQRMVQVARCESKLNPRARSTTNDLGVFQIHLPAHQRSLNGVDLYDPRQNIRFARKLYEQNRLTPWNSSRHCWAT